MARRAGKRGERKAEQQEKQERKKSIDWLVLIAAIIVCQLAGVVGSLFTFPAITGWYAGLNKPFFSPPNWVFGPVWVSLYALMGIAAYLIWQKGAERHEVKTALKIFGSQLALNALWSILFFGMKSPLLGLACIILLWLAIALTIERFYRIEKNAAYLLVPYLMWVSFASVLNFAVWLLNP